MHSGHTDRSYVDWEVGALPDVDPSEASSRQLPVYGFDPVDEDDLDEEVREEELRAYGEIVVDRCVYCRSRDLEVSFVFVQPPGLKVAVPGRVGLCATCHRLLHAGDLQALLGRTRGAGFEDFPDGAVLDLIRASRAALLDSR